MALALSRRPGEKIIFIAGPHHFQLEVVAVEGTKVKLAFTAPDEVRIIREELLWNPASPPPQVQHAPGSVCGPDDDCRTIWEDKP